MRNTTLKLAFVVAAFASTSIATPNADLLQIREAYFSFQSGAGEVFLADHGHTVKHLTVQAEGMQRHFYGIHEADLNETFPYADFKTKMLEVMGIQGRKIVEVVGSVKPPFAPEAGEYARQWLKQELQGADLIEYGVTSAKGLEDPTVNAFVSLSLQSGEYTPGQVLGNVVGHSVVALDAWKCNYPQNIKHLVLVYNDTTPIKSKESGKYNSGFTVFGGDIRISDLILRAADHDEMKVVDGGPQSLAQAVTAIKLGLKVKGIYGVRDAENPMNFGEGGIPLLSAAEFLHQLQKYLTDAGEMTVDRAREFYGKYLQSHGGWNIGANDADTKSPMMAQVERDLFQVSVLQNLMTNYEAVDYLQVAK